MAQPISWPLERAYAAPSLAWGGRTFLWGSRTFILGVINATPDSFSGDGLAGDPAAAAREAAAFAGAGADAIDIGGESSRPGATPLDPREEAARVLPCIEAVRSVTDLPISVDTCHASVAALALKAGATAVNDIWGLRHDAGMPRVVAEAGAALIAMHNQRGRAFHDVAADIAAGFEATLAICENHGIPAGRVVLDPGFGFGWTPAQNLEMLRRLPELWRFERPLLVGTSRKSTLGLILDSPASDRLEGTLASVAVAIAAGADFVRVHDVAAVARVARVTDAIVRANWREAPR